MYPKNILGFTTIFLLSTASFHPSLSTFHLDARQSVETIHAVVIM